MQSYDFAPLVQAANQERFLALACAYCDSIIVVILTELSAAAHVYAS